jgi:hypothetical protein
MTKEPKYADGSDIELESRLESAEDLRLKALEDGVRDVAREARIERLESAGDMVEENRLAIKNGALADGNWHSDRGKVKPAETEKTWYKLSDRRQQIELQKIAGTYRPGRGDPRSKSRKPDTSEDRIFTPGSLHDKHESAHVRRNNTVADGIIKADRAKAKTKAKTKAKPQLPAPEQILGYCRECNGPIPRNMRADAVFCSEAHSKAFRRREMAKEVANRALFKDHKPAPGPEFPFYCPPPAPDPTPPMTASYAARSGRVGEYLASRLVRDNSILVQ